MRKPLSKAVIKGRSRGRLNENKLIQAIAETAHSKRALQIEIFDVAKHVDYTDYVLVCSGRSERQVKAIAEGIEAKAKELGASLIGQEGKQQSQWVLLDFDVVIVHIFIEQARGYYDVEGLWLDAKRVPFEEPRAAAAGG